MSKNILITGSHRSGSTWTGKMIALSNEVSYVHEPLNKNKKICPECRLKIDFWFPYINKNNSKKYKKHIRHSLNFRYNHIYKIIKIFNIYKIKRLVEEYVNYFKFKFGANRVLIKDPIALFSAEHLNKDFDMDVVVLIRHPLAFVASLKVKNWKFDFSEFLKQEYLMKDKLEPFRKDIEKYSKNEHDIVDQGILLWNIFHTVIADYQRKYNWIFVKHEDLSRNPIKEFEKIYKRLNIEYTNEIRERIKRHTRAKRSTNHKRDSKKNIHLWKKRLNSEEIERIRSKTKKIASLYY
jgi:hypothetical protein